MTAAGFLKVPRILFDSAICSAIGVNALWVYLTIRRFERVEGSFSPRIEREREKGWLIGYANQTKIALLSGLSRSTVSRAIKLLTQIKWIREIRLKDNGRAYIVGFESHPETNGRVHCVYFADEWIEKTFTDFSKQLRDWRHDAIKKRRVALVEALQRVVDAKEDP
ncbi:MAG TPA: hypothetical protein VGF94_19165 [Kofleriaceae bacterium]|jgi:DNA-binding MarR family transcriptional regulator